MRDYYLDLEECLDLALSRVHKTMGLPVIDKDSGRPFKVHGSKAHNWYLADRFGYKTGRYGRYRFKKHITRG
jgi:hypothetical protein